MTITFENDNDVIVYALEKVISYARNTQQIFVAQCVWWLASIIGLEQGLTSFIDNLQSRRKVVVIPEEPEAVVRKTVSPDPKDIQEERRERIFKECEGYLRDSRQLGRVATLKATGKTLTGLINPTAVTKRHLRKEARHKRRLVESLEERFPRSAGVDETEVERRKKAGECLRCAWPSERKGAHRVKDCRRPVKPDRGTARLPRKERLQEEASEAKVSSESSSDDSV